MKVELLETYSKPLTVTLLTTSLSVLKVPLDSRMLLVTISDPPVNVMVEVKLKFAL